jgi:hypothetical protein
MRGKVGLETECQRVVLLKKQILEIITITCTRFYKAT